MRLHRLLFPVLIVLGLSGCAALTDFGSAVVRGYPQPLAARLAWLKAHPGDAHRRQIKAGRVTPGMTQAEALAAWGTPNAASSLNESLNDSTESIAFFVPPMGPQTMTWLGGDGRYTIVHLSAQGIVTSVGSARGVLSEQPLRFRRRRRCARRGHS